MNNIYFDSVIQIGKLYLEYVFYEFEKEPILFSCVDEEGGSYLCLCSEIRYGQKWIIVQCNIAILKALIEEDIDVATAFLKSPTAVVITMDLQGNESSCVIDMGKVDRLDLPKEGIFIQGDKEKLKNYLWKKECEILFAQKKMLSRMPIMNEVSRSYSAAFDQTICIQSKQRDMYSDSISKDFVDRSGRFSGLWKTPMEIRREYVIHTKSSYVEVAERSASVNDGYFEVA